MKNNHKHKNLPKPSEFFIKKILPDEGWDSPVGDFEEDFNEIVSESGILRAWYWYFKQILKLLPQKVFISFVWSIVMLKNYLKSTFRNIKRQKLFSVINISGLAIGIGCTILIYLFINDELSYDKFHKKSDKIYRLTTNLHNPDGSVKSRYGRAPLPHGPAVNEFFPDVISCVRTWPLGFIVKRENVSEDVQVYFADADFFKMFTFPLLKGEASSVLSRPNSAVLSETYAKKFFGDKDPVGEIITILADQTGSSNDFLVTGVFEDPPSNSTVSPKIVTCFENLKLFGWEQFFTIWGFLPSGSTFIEVRDKNSEKRILKDFHLFTERYCAAPFSELRKSIFRKNKSDKDPLSFGMQKLTDIHLDPEASGSPDLTTLLVLNGIAVIILFIACINFITLSIGNVSKRFMEISVRKVFGAGRKQLIRQFRSEAFLTTALTVIPALIIVFFALPVFNRLTIKSLRFDSLLSFSNLSVLALLILIVGTIAGSYPAYVMARLKPAAAFKGKFKLGGKNIFTQSLVVTQFVLSLILFTSAIFLGKQINFMINKDHGFDTENILFIDMRTSSIEESEKLFNFLKDRLENQAGIISVSGSSHLLPRSHSKDRIVYEGVTFPDVAVTVVYPNYLNTMGIRVAEGRDFSPQLTTDKKNIIVNETLVKKLEIREPLGKQIKIGDESFTIIGVTENFNLKGYKYHVCPAVFQLKQRSEVFSMYRLKQMVLKISPLNISKTMELIRSTWKEIQPDKPFLYCFLDENINRLFLEEKRWSNIVVYSSGLAILIACMGVFGLTSITVSRRTREIGIRKVHGASIKNILFLLSGEPAKWVLIASVTAMPAGYFIVYKWLQNFAYKISISINIYIAASLIMMILVLSTTCIQIIKAAKAKPVDSLRYE